jgi:hypothetical protein
VAALTRGKLNRSAQRIISPGGQSHVMHYAGSAPRTGSKAGWRAGRRRPAVRYCRQRARDPA